MSSTSKPISLPVISEREHPLIAPLLTCPDQELLSRWQQHPEQGQYFTALFCRYGHLVYSLLAYQAQSPIQVDYLFAKTWQSIFRDLNQSLLDLSQFLSETTATLQPWILNHAAASIHHQEVPGIESIHYSLSDASPPLWCYLELALSQLSSQSRLTVLMSQTFHWSEQRIAAYLQDKGEEISVEQVWEQLQQGYQQLQTLLPTDIQALYLESPSGAKTVTEAG